MPECRLAVLGLCSADMERGAAGVGKSCLCSRFVRPCVDDWRATGSDHSPWLDQADFQEPEIGGDHFLYFGVGRRDFYLMREKGKSEGNGLSVHLVEHTVFVDSFTGKAFPGAESYEHRATSAQVKSKGRNKPAYTCRTHVGEGAEDKSQGKVATFPSGYSSNRGKDAGVQGYLYVLDPTTGERSRRDQWRMWEKCWAGIPASKRDAAVAIVLTKCDVFCSHRTAPSLDKSFNVVEHFTGTTEAGKFRDDASRIGIKCGKASVPVFFVSAETGVGVDLPFMHVGHRSAGLRGQPLGPVPWPSAIQLQHELQQATLRAGDAFMLSNVTRDTQTWGQCMPPLLVYTAMDMCRVVNGIDECKALFRSRLLALMTARAQDELAPKQLGNGCQYSTVLGRPYSEKFKERLLKLIQEHPDFSSFVEGPDSSQGSGTNQHLGKDIRQLLVKSRQRSVYRSRKPQPLPSDEDNAVQQVSPDCAVPGDNSTQQVSPDCAAPGDDEHHEAIAMWSSKLYLDMTGNGREHLDDTGENQRWSDQQLEDAAEIFRSAPSDSPSPSFVQPRFRFGHESGGYLEPIEDTTSPASDSACQAAFSSSAPGGSFVSPDQVPPLLPARSGPCSAPSDKSRVLSTIQTDASLVYEHGVWEDDEADDCPQEPLAGHCPASPRIDPHDELQPYAQFAQAVVDVDGYGDYVPMDGLTGDCDDDIAVSPYAQFRAQQSVRESSSPRRLPGTLPRPSHAAVPGGDETISSDSLPRRWTPVVRVRCSSVPSSPVARRHDEPISNASNSCSGESDPHLATDSPTLSTLVRSVYPKHRTPAGNRLPGASPTPLRRLQH